MSPQFVDFDADGKLDIVAGTFDGSPHLARGDGTGWNQPEQILDANGRRIVLNAFWNFDTKKWDKSTDGNADGESGEERQRQEVVFTGIVHFECHGNYKARAKSQRPKTKDQRPSTGPSSPFACAQGSLGMTRAPSDVAIPTCERVWGTRAD